MLQLEKFSVTCPLMFWIESGVLGHDGLEVRVSRSTTCRFQVVLEMVMPKNWYEL